MLMHTYTNDPDKLLAGLIKGQVYGSSAARGREGEEWRVVRCPLMITEALGQDLCSFHCFCLGVMGRGRCWLEILSCLEDMQHGTKSMSCWVHVCAVVWTGELTRMNRSGSYLSLGVSVWRRGSEKSLSCELLRRRSQGRLKSASSNSPHRINPFSRLILNSLSVFTIIML